MLLLRYVIRSGWLEAFESALPDGTGVDDAAFRGAPWTAKRCCGERRDPLSQTRGSFGVFELVRLDADADADALALAGRVQQLSLGARNGAAPPGETAVARVADASTRFAHLASKVELAKWVRRRPPTEPDVCPASGWLRWDAFEHCALEAFLAHGGEEGAEFLREVSPERPWVLKRDGASGGKGVCFVSSPEDVFREVEQGRELEEALPFLDERRGGVANWAAQRHIDAPLLLLGGHKCHLRAYVLSVRRRAFVYRNFEVRIAPEPWDPDFGDLGRHITNGGGSEAHHERRFLADEFPELRAARAALPEFLASVVSAPHSRETDELDASWTPAAVMGLDIMVDAVSGRLHLLEANHSPASPPFDELSRFGRHVRRFAKNAVALLVTFAASPDEPSATAGAFHFFEVVGRG